MKQKRVEFLLVSNLDTLYQDLEAFCQMHPQLEYLHFSCYNLFDGNITFQHHDWMLSRLKSLVYACDRPDASNYFRNSFSKSDEMKFVSYFFSRYHIEANLCVPQFRGVARR